MVIQKIKKDLFQVKGGEKNEKEIHKKGYEATQSIDRANGMQGLWSQTYCQSCKWREIRQGILAMHQWL